MDTARLRERIGPWGVDTFRTNFLSPSEAALLARGLDEQGWPVLWIPEIGLTEAFSEAGHLLANTDQLMVVSAIARVGDRSPGNAAAAHAYLRRAYGGRHVLGLGLGPLARQPSPMQVLNDWLDEFDAADEQFGGEATTMLAAYGPKMLQLGGERSLGAMTYLVTPEHTINSRRLLGDESVLVAEQAVIFTEDETEAREIARAHTAPYVGSPPHERKFAALGFEPEDWTGGHSDRLIDALIAWGSVEDCVARLQQHRDAGADHVACCILGTDALEDDLAAHAQLAAALGV
ncbi:MAG: TIGR03620 family F420-dependent LLM class oxidoreductase [Actinomycetota bacterium]